MIDNNNKIDLFYGPSNSGKTTAAKSLKSMEIFYIMYGPEVDFDELLCFYKKKTTEEKCIIIDDFDMFTPIEQQQFIKYTAQADIKMILICTNKYKIIKHFLDNAVLTEFKPINDGVKMHFCDELIKNINAKNMANTIDIYNKLLEQYHPYDIADELQQQFNDKFQQKLMTLICNNNVTHIQLINLIIQLVAE